MLHDSSTTTRTPPVRPTDRRDWMSAMLGVYAAMPDEEKEQLHDWERQYVTGDCEYGTSDWPGWIKYIGKPPWKLESDARQRGQGDGKRRTRWGFVYVIQGRGQFKIGRAVDPQQRIKAIAGSLPFTVQTVAILEAEDAAAFERELHRAFAEKRLGGEWFALTADDLAVIEARWGDHIVR